jgi:hypothetical protein
MLSDCRLENAREAIQDRYSANRHKDRGVNPNCRTGDGLGAQTFPRHLQDIPMFGSN